MLSKLRTKLPLPGAAMVLYYLLTLWFFCTGLPMGTPGRLLMFSASGKLREIMWKHVIYYSLGIWFALMMGVLFRLIFGRRNVRAALNVAGFSRRYWVWLGILFILSVLCGLEQHELERIHCGEFLIMVYDINIVSK